MGADTGSYVCTVLLVSRRPAYAPNAVYRRWSRLMSSLSDPYRPELHYMRGPGPKWREKHARNANGACRERAADSVG
jgi:hypothetical protein